MAYEIAMQLAIIRVSEIVNQLQGGSKAPTFFATALYAPENLASAGVIISTIIDPTRDSQNRIANFPQSISFSSFTARSKSSDRVSTIVAASFNRAKFGANDEPDAPSRLSLRPSSQSALTPKVLEIWATVCAAGSLTPRSQELYEVCFTPILWAKSH